MSKSLKAELELNSQERNTPPWGQIHLGDCLSICADWPAAQVDLVYLDPPFFTRRDHVGTGRVDHLNGAPLTFGDRWQGGLHDYLTWLEQCVRAAVRLLKPTGVFLLHLDWHAVHYVKVMCDGVFAETGGTFQNELIWHYQTGGAS